MLAATKVTAPTSARSKIDDEGRQGRSAKNEALANSLEDAEVLVAYVIRNNIQEVQDAVTGIAEARECYGRGEFSGAAQKKFYADFSTLAAKGVPVTVTTLKASLESYGPGRRRWFGLGERVLCSHAQRAGIFHRRWGMVALITLLVIQSYWLVGSNLLNAIPKFSDAQQTALLAVEAKKKTSLEGRSASTTSAIFSGADAACNIPSDPTAGPYAISSGTAAAG